MSNFVTPQSHDEEVRKIHADVKAELPTSNPYLKDSLVRAQNTGLGRRVFDVYYTMRSWLENFFPNTSKGPYQQMWKEVRNIQAVAASKGSGYITATGTLTSTITAGETLKINGVVYETQTTESISTVVRDVVSLTKLGGTVTCETDGHHGLADGMTVTIAGATASNDNGTFTNVVVIADDKFTYQNAFSSTTSTGTITASFVGAEIEVESVLASLDANQDGGTQLQFESEITGVDEYAGVQFLGITGGANAETEDEINQRLAETFANPITSNNGNHIKRVIFDLDKNNTRIWIHYAYPAAGEVTVYFVRDNDTDIIPSATDEANALAAVQDVYNAHTDPDDIHVTGPTGVSVDVTISNVTPATSGMREAVRNTVIAYYRSRNDEGVDDDPAKLTSAIYQTVDPNTGDRLEYMVLGTPATYTNCTIGQIPVLGNLVVS